MSAADFEEALAQLVLQESLRIRSSQQGWLLRTSTASAPTTTPWQGLLRKSFGGMCRPHQPKQDCLSLLDDVMGLSDTDKLAVAVGLSFAPMSESIARAVENTVTPQLFYAAIATTMVTWVVLAANPEPVFTKAAAIVSAVLLVYLGSDAFLEVLKASFELRRATAQAVTFEELEEASQRFGRVMGEQGTRIFILVVTVLVSRGAMGGASLLSARLPLLPHFMEASSVGATQLGIRLAAVEQVSRVAVVEGQLTVTLAPTAVAMVAGSNEGAAHAGGGETAAEAPHYRETFFSAHPELRDKVVVHHAIEQQVLKRYPGLFTEAEIHSLSNLRGIPKSINPDIHLSKIRRAWNEFYRSYSKPTKQEVHDFAAQLDRQWGAIFRPPVSLGGHAP
ncbi:hypothetical protein [Hyalangium rubrum]|uniref:Lipoprotein n=1 Tax=Hyalangium rubrum TaxID=3103134 RepID=A0ABU5H671_9BACT|nr:hypothetical protein [Hyalangium sp. s54d21]MDY7228977.1 hypothetical protein [Hyalangium sp. s54d21]